MGDFQKDIYLKLTHFVRKFYTNELIRGAVFFVGLGLLFLFFIIFIEYFLWLQPASRTILFFVFVFVELFLLGRYIIYPVARLLKLAKGINFTQASHIIGKHFPEVSDKLLNFLQLSDRAEASELLQASIQQKSAALRVVPFQNAINLSANRRFVPLLLIPFFIYLLVLLSGKSDLVTQSLGRVVRFQADFQKPALFRFVVQESKLVCQQGQDFIVKASTVGDVRPESVSVNIGSESYVMKSVGGGMFEFVVSKPMVDLQFVLSANGVRSNTYNLDVVLVPTISNLQLRVNYPSYLNKPSEVVAGSGNLVVPEGSVLTWQIAAVATDKISFVSQGQQVAFKKDNTTFFFKKMISQNIDYQIITANKTIGAFDTLDYAITTIKDLFPSINVDKVPNVSADQGIFLAGKVADDHGLSRLQVVFYPVGNVGQAKRNNIVLKSNKADTFVFSFPGTLDVVQGVSYEYYFEVFDNDAVHNFKSARSDVYSQAILTDVQKNDLLLQQEGENIGGISKSAKDSQKQITQIDKLQKVAKEKENFDYNEQKKVEDFINKQNKHEQSVKEFVSKLRNNFEKSKEINPSELKTELEKRLEAQIKQAEANQKLLQQLDDLNQKLKKDELSTALDKFKQQAKNQAKNLEQLVELTKRYYVEKKAEQLIDKLMKLAADQEQLATKDQENNKDNQEKINKQFDEIQSDLKNLERENKDLKSPIDIPKDADKEKSIDDDLKKAAEELQKDAKAGKDKAKPKQNSAAKKMKELGSKMKEGMEADGMEKLEEDVAMLRQILDNLLLFSFAEESTMSQFVSIKRNSPAYNKGLKQQQDLRLQFQHVDDSLFALGLRNPKIAESINAEIGNVHYNVNKAVETLVEANISKGVYHQQYAVSAANKLADMLSETLSNMQMDMQGSGKGKPKKGKGKGSGMQLPDIIKKQESLSKKLEKGMKPGSKPGDKPGNSPGGKPSPDGKAGAEGDGGKDGEGNAGEIMQIYQEQKQLREALQQELNQKGLGGSGQNVLDQMKQLEKQLINKGFKNDVLQKSLNIKQELLKLDKAVQEQGQEQKRQGESSKQQFNSKAAVLPEEVRKFLISTEILNKQSLPLRKNYESKTQLYFNSK